MEKITEDDAKIIAKNLSYNLYYEDNFTPSSFRVFLENLPLVAFVHFTLRKDNEDLVFPSCSAQITFADSKYRSILIVMASDWMFTTFWVKIRPVPVRYVIDGVIDNLPF